jgi:uncharacterized membrane protein YqjE
MPMDDTDAPVTTPGGLFDSLRALIATLVAMAHTRVELFGTEIEEELRRVVALVVGAMAVLALSGLALLFSALVVIVMFWDTHRVAAAASVAIGFIALSIIGFLVVRARTRRRSRFLSSTLGELERDVQQLAGRRSP